MAIETETRELRYLKVKLEACNNELDVGEKEKHFSKWTPQIHEPRETTTNVC